MISGDLAACAAIVERGDPQRFRAAMAAPVAARAVLFPVYAFNIEVSRAPYVSQEPMISEMRLQWWAEGLEEIIGGGLVRRHEVVLPLAQAVDAEGARLLQEVVEARRQDLELAPFDDAAALWSYLDATSGALMLAAARGLGEAAPEVVRGHGQAVGLANYLVAVPRLVEMNRRPLPDASDAAIAALAREGLDRLKAARRGRRAVSSRAAPALIGGWEAGAILRRAARHPALVRSGGLEPGAFRSSLGLALRAATGRW